MTVTTRDRIDVWALKDELRIIKAQRAKVRELLRKADPRDLLSLQETLAEISREVGV